MYTYIHMRFLCIQTFCIHRCWLPQEEGLIAAFVVPMLAIIAVSPINELCSHITYGCMCSVTTLTQPCSKLVLCLCVGTLHR